MNYLTFDCPIDTMDAVFTNCGLEFHLGIHKDGKLRFRDLEGYTRTNKGVFNFLEECVAVNSCTKKQLEQINEYSKEWNKGVGLLDKLIEWHQSRMNYDKYKGCLNAINRFERIEGDTFDDVFEEIELRNGLGILHLVSSIDLDVPYMVHCQIDLINKVYLKFLDDVPVKGVSFVNIKDMERFLSDMESSEMLFVEDKEKDIYYSVKKTNDGGWYRIASEHENL